MPYNLTIQPDPPDQPVPVLASRAFPPGKRRDLPRLFWMEYDLSKTPRLRRSDKIVKYSCWGTLYPRGTVSLDIGVVFTTMSELREHFEQSGKYSISWFEEEEE